MLDTTTEEAPPLQKGRPEVVEIVVERIRDIGRATRINKEYKRDVNN